MYFALYSVPRREGLELSRQWRGLLHAESTVCCVVSRGRGTSSYQRLMPGPSCCAARRQALHVVIKNSIKIWMLIKQTARMMA